MSHTESIGFDEHKQARPPGTEMLNYIAWYNMLSLTCLIPVDIAQGLVLSILWSANKIGLHVAHSGRCKQNFFLVKAELFLSFLLSEHSCLPTTWLGAAVVIHG